MIGLIQRVSHAQVDIENVTVGKINAGLLALIGIEKGDTSKQADRLLERILSYRVFEDNEEKMNLSLSDTGGGLLLVSQFTLAANTQKGNRPSFTSAMPPNEARILFAYMLDKAKQQHSGVESGKFGANMQVSLCNDGPVTFSLRVPPQN